MLFQEKNTDVKWTYLYTSGPYDQTSSSAQDSSLVSIQILVSQSLTKKNQY